MGELDAQGEPLDGDRCAAHDSLAVGMTFVVVAAVVPSSAPCLG